MDEGWGGEERGMRDKGEEGGRVPEHARRMRGKEGGSRRSRASYRKHILFPTDGEKPPKPGYQTSFFSFYHALASPLSDTG